MRLKKRPAQKLDVVAVSARRLGDGFGDALEHGLGCLDDFAVLVALEIARAQDFQSSAGKTLILGRNGHLGLPPRV